MFKERKHFRLQTKFRILTAGPRDRSELRAPLAVNKLSEQYLSVKFCEVSQLNIPEPSTLLLYLIYCYHPV